MGAEDSATGVNPSMELAPIRGARLAEPSTAPLLRRIQTTGSFFEI
jgi:hypothetical protein